MRVPVVLTLVLTAVLAAGCITTPVGGRVYVRIGPPPVVVEHRVPPPGRDYVWVPGYYRWDGRVYVWMPGRYVLPPRPRAVWIPPHWRRDRHGWYFIEGHWRY